MKDENEKKFYDYRNDITKALRGIKNLKNFKAKHEKDFAIFLASFLKFINTSTNAELAEEIYKYQYNQHSSFTMQLYKVMYGSDEQNLAKLFFVYPKESTAFQKYGRTGTATLLNIMNENKK